MPTNIKYNIRHGCAPQLPFRIYNNYRFYDKTKLSNPICYTFFSFFTPFFSQFWFCSTSFLLLSLATCHAFGSVISGYGLEKQKQKHRKITIITPTHSPTVADNYGEINACEFYLLPNQPEKLMLVAKR